MRTTYSILIKTGEPDSCDGFASAFIALIHAMDELKDIGLRYGAMHVVHAVTLIEEAFCISLGFGTSRAIGDIGTRGVVRQKRRPP